MRKISPPVAEPRHEPGDSALRFRGGVICCGLLVAFSLVCWRLIHLQVDRHPELAARVATSHSRVDKLKAHRGTIFDTRRRLLAVDAPVRGILFDGTFLRQGEALARFVGRVENLEPRDLLHALSLEELQERYLRHVATLAAPVVGREAEEIVKSIRESLRQAPLRPALIAKALPVSEALRLREILENAGLGTYQESRSRVGGVIFQEEYERVYPPRIPLSHVVGLVAEPPSDKKKGERPKPIQGVSGVEKFFNKELAGVDGRRTLEVDAMGNEIPAWRGPVTPPRHGKNLRISLDCGLQEILEATLDERGNAAGEVYVPDLQADRVIVVLFDPETMGVRAIGCRDNTKPKDHLMLTNPALELSYEPGSTIKIVTAALALSSGRIAPGVPIPISSTGVYDDGDVSSIRDEHPYPRLDVEGIIVKSSNIGAYKLARMLGVTKFAEGVRDFGFGQKTGMESPWESPGLLAPRMNLQTLSRVSFGYAINVTPAQMCGALGCVINDGVYRPLRLAEAWVDDEGNTLEPVSAPEPRRVVTAEAAAVVRRAMLEVVEKGTAKAGRSKLYEIAGKTGTARKARTGARGYQPGHYVVSFVGFLPARKPRLGGIVIVDTPRSTTHARYGGSIAAPLFRRIGERAMAYYEVPPQMDPALEGAPSAAVNFPVNDPLQAAPR